MPIRNLSLASALILVGLGFCANAGINLATSDEGWALAADRKGESIPASSPGEVALPVRPMFGGELGRSQRADGGAELMAMGGCIQVAPQQWFGAIRALPPCSPTQIFRRGGATDVNQDGIDEAVDVTYTQIIQAGVPLPATCLVEQFEIAVDEGDLAITKSCVLSSTQVMGYAQSLAGAGGSVTAFYEGGWYDMDGDGDLDLCVRFIVNWNNENYAWLENTGFEAAQPLIGDLNQDGSVNAADLTMLLGGWTGN